MMRPDSISSLLVLGFVSVAAACGTGNFIPLSGANALYYVDTTSTENLLISTYFFDADCTAVVPVQLIGPGGVTVPCADLQEPGAGQFADTVCQPMNTFVDGQYQLQWLGNIFQFNDFRVTTAQAIVTITPTVTITSTPLTTITQTATLTEPETFEYTPPAVTSPAVTDTITVTPRRSIEYTTKTWTRTRLQVTYTAVPTIKPVAPICIISKPPKCKPLKRKPRFLGRSYESYAAPQPDSLEERGAAEHDNIYQLVKRAGANRLQPVSSTTTLTADLPIVTVTTTTSTISEAATVVVTSTTTETLATPTVYSGISVQLTTLPAKTKTRTKYTVTVQSVTITKTKTYTITSTRDPSPAEITNCHKKGGHF